MCKFLANSHFANSLWPNNKIKVHRYPCFSTEILSDYEKPIFDWLGNEYFSIEPRQQPAIRNIVMVHTPQKKAFRIHAEPRCLGWFNVFHLDIPFVTVTVHLMFNESMQNPRPSSVASATTGRAAHSKQAICSTIIPQKIRRK